MKRTYKTGIEQICMREISSFIEEVMRARKIIDKTVSVDA